MILIPLIYLKESTFFSKPWGENLQFLIFP